MEGGCPHIVGRCVIVGGTFPPAPEQLAKTKLPVTQVDMMEAAYKKADEQPTPNSKLMAFNSLVELVKALSGLLNYFPTTKMQYINDGPRHGLSVATVLINHTIMCTGKTAQDAGFEWRVGTGRELPGSTSCWRIWRKPLSPKEV